LSIPNAKAGHKEVWFRQMPLYISQIPVIHKCITYRAFTYGLKDTSRCH